MEFNLVLTAERSVVRESLKGIIWTIFFNRLLGPITPTTVDFFNVTYSMASNLYDLDSVIDEKVNQLIKGSFDKVEGKTPNTGQVIIRFYDGKLLKGRKLSGGSVDTGGGGGGWFSAGASTTSKTNDNAWELWTITVECLPIEEHKEASSGSTKEINGNIKLSIKSFEDNLNQIFTTVDTHKDHIPPITSTASVTFPYTITIDTGIPPRISAEEVTSSQPPPPSTTMGQWWK